MPWKVTGFNAAELEILVTRDDGAAGVVKSDHRSTEWKRACREIGWQWPDETRIVAAQDADSLEARIDTILGDSIDIRQVKEAFGLLCAEIRELKAASIKNVVIPVPKQ